MTLATTDTGRFDSERTMGLINYGLLFSALFFGGVPAIVAVVLAYTQRGSAGPTVREHYRFQIQIFWIGFLLSLIAGICGVWGVVELTGDAWRNGSSHGEMQVDETDFTVRVIGLFIASAVSLILLTLWSLAAPAIGFIRLATAPRPAAAA